MFITCRLHGSLPVGREFPNEGMNSGQAFVRMDRLLEECRSGPTYLKMPDIAQLAADAIRQGAPSDYDLDAWVIMPNHVHLLITPHIHISKLMQKLKGTIAHESNKLLRQTGEPFWQRESYDRLVRDAEEFRRIESYILRNPVRAGLARSAEEYPWLGGLKPAAG
jgi:putative transposase